MAADRKFRWSEDQQAFVNRVSGEAIPDDEPVIIFRARDRHAYEVLSYYLTLIGDPHHQQAVRERIEEFRAFRCDHPTRMKEPGITRAIVLNKEKSDG